LQHETKPGQSDGFDTFAFGIAFVAGVNDKSLAWLNVVQGIVEAFFLPVL